MSENEANVKKEQVDNNPYGGKKKVSASTVIFVVVIVVIILAFIALICYERLIKPNSDFDKELGYKVEDYIEVDSYKGFDYEITQEMFDDSVHEETDYYDEVSRAAKETDQVEFNYTGYVDGEKSDDLSQKSIEVVLGEDEEGIYKVFSDAITGHKSGETIEVDGIDTEDASLLSLGGNDYSGSDITFSIKIKNVSKLVRDEVTDEWVADYYLDDYGLEDTNDFYDWCKSYIEEDAKSELWQMALDGTYMSGYPQDVYDDVVLEFTQDANYYADMFSMTTEEYLEDFCGYTDETLEEEYLNEVKSELLMWYIVKKQGFEASEEDIEDEYYALYDEMGYDTADDMREDYTDDEMREVVLLDKAQSYVYDHSNVVESFVIPESN